MFADALLDSHHQSRRGWATLTSFGLQAIAVACLLILPLLYTQVLPFMQPPAIHMVAPIGDTAPVRQNVSTQSARGGPSIYAIIRNDGLIVPHLQPRGTDPGTDVAPPDFPITGPGNGQRSGGPITGIWGSFGPGTPPVIPQHPTTKAPPISAMMEGSLIHKVEPVYPTIAISARIQGNVVLGAVIGRDGTVQNLQVLSGHPLLAPAAVKAVSQWRYRPYVLNGSPIEVNTQVTVNFILAR